MIVQEGGYTAAFLDEWPDAVAWTGILATGIGVALANGSGGGAAGPAGPARG